MDNISVAVLDTNYAYVLYEHQLCLVIDPGSAQEAPSQWFPGRR